MTCKNCQSEMDPKHKRCHGCGIENPSFQLPGDPADKKRIADLEKELEDAKKAVKKGLEL